MTQETKELILNSDIIAALKNETNYSKFFKLLQTDTPEEWTMEGVSDITGEKYRYLSIRTLEFLMELLFEPFYNDKIIHQNTYTHNNTSVVSISVEITFSKYFGLDINQVNFHKTGTASVCVTDNFYFNKDGEMKFVEKVKKPVKSLQMLATATPLCLTEARKNALRNICNLFGRNLHREELYTLKEEEFEKIKPDAIILKKYQNALKKGDTKIIEEIESNYLVEEL